MKICPQCQVTYPDDSLLFCLQDGSRLVPIANQSSQMPTQSFREEETVVARKEPSTWQQSRVIQTPVQPSNSGSSSKLAVILSGIIAILLLGIIGIGAWVLLSPNGKTEIAQTASPTPALQNMNSNARTSPTPTASATPPSNIFTKTPSNSNAAFNSTPVSTPTQNFDPEQVRNDVSSRISSWKSGLESGSLSAVMGNYADRLDYYFNKGGVSAGSVRADKQRAFELFNSFRVNLSNMRVVSDAGGEKATAIFDKEWAFTGTKNNSGKVQSQLQLTKINGQWKITGEKDLKVYYVNK